MDKNMLVASIIFVILLILLGIASSMLIGWVNQFS